MQMGKKFVLKLSIWSFLMLYLLCDLILFNGPLKRQVHRIQGKPEQAILHDSQRGIVARVFGQPILLSQVDYAVDEHLWRTGRSRNQISKNALKNLQQFYLYELIDHALLRQKVSLNAKHYPVTETEIDQGVKRFKKRFQSPETMQKAMQQFDFKGDKELRYRIAARIQQEKYLREHLLPGIQVTSQDVQAFYQAHKKALTTPELKRVRHIFLSKEKYSAEEALRILQQCQTQLTENQSFQQLAALHSQDKRTQHSGGDLGWISRHRVPEDFASALSKIPKHQPTLTETKIGWHLIEITDTKAPHLQSLEALSSEITAALETSRLKKAVQEYRKNLRRQHAPYIKIHESLLQ